MHGGGRWGAGTATDAALRMSQRQPLRPCPQASAKSLACQSSRWLPCAAFIARMCGSHSLAASPQRADGEPWLLPPPRRDDAAFSRALFIGLEREDGPGPACEACFRKKRLRHVSSTRRNPGLPVTWGGTRTWRYRARPIMLCRFRCSRRADWGTGSEEGPLCFVVSCGRTEPES